MQLYHAAAAGGSAAAAAAALPRVHLLYRPGHYDILYPRLEGPAVAPAAGSSAAGAAVGRHDQA